MSTNTIDQLIEGLDAPQRENVLKALADAHVSAHDPFLAVMLAVSYKIQKNNVVVQSPSQMGGRSLRWVNWVCAAVGVVGMLTTWAGYNYKREAEDRVALMATEIRENGKLLEDLRSTGGSMRYYEAEDVHGKKIRILNVNGGSVRPSEAFINAAGAATVNFPVLPNNQNPTK